MKKSDEKQLNKLQEITKGLSEVSGKWSLKQRMCKAKFWSRASENPDILLTGVSLSLARRVTDEPQLDKWWSDPEFYAWFKDRDVIKEKIMFARELGIDVAIHGLINPCISERDRQGYLRFIRDVSADLKEESKEGEDLPVLPAPSGDSEADLDSINKQLELLENE